VDAELTLDVPGGAINATLRTPRQLSQHPALLINLGGSAQAALNEQPYRIAADIFLAAGHHVVSFDLPCHGRRGSEYGGGLSGMAKAIAAGVDVFGNIQDTGRVLIRRCIDRAGSAPMRFWFMAHPAVGWRPSMWRPPTGACWLSPPRFR